MVYPQNYFNCSTLVLAFEKVIKFFQFVKLIFLLIEELDIFPSPRI
jgi:hypothetical protein